jgi:hypothetical protein
MKPAWDQLGAEYADSTSVVIGDADCTASAQELCTDFEVCVGVWRRKNTS